MPEKEVLLKLRRKYSKDEIVSAINKSLSQSEVEIGQLKSEIDYLTSENAKLKDLNDAMKDNFKIGHADKIELEAPIYAIHKHRNKKLMDEVEKLKKSNKELVEKLIRERNK